MTDDPRDLTRSTLTHYGETVDSFWQGTRDHDVSQNRAALLDAIEAEPPFAILDFGCGPGRDLICFKSLGHEAVGLEGAAGMADMARRQSGCEVMQQDFVAMDLPAARFDGIFANASLFHVPRRELPRVLEELHETLKPGGVLFTSNPRGDNEEVMNGERLCSFHDLEAWRGYVGGAGFTELRHYYRPEGKPRDQQPWLATVWRRT